MIVPLEKSEVRNDINITLQHVGSRSLLPGLGMKNNSSLFVQPLITVIYSLSGPVSTHIMKTGAEKRLPRSKTSLRTRNNSQPSSQGKNTQTPLVVHKETEHVETVCLSEAAIQVNFTACRSRETIRYCGSAKSCVSELISHKNHLALWPPCVAIESVPNTSLVWLCAEKYLCVAAYNRTETNECCIISVLRLITAD